jgi:hypothetical protein
VLLHLQRQRHHLPGKIAHPLRTSVGPTALVVELARILIQPPRASLSVLSQVLIGVLLQKEPLYIQGVDAPDEAASSCFMAAGIYTLFVIGTAACIWKNEKRQRDLSGVMDGNETIGIKDSFEGGYGR